MTAYILSALIGYICGSLPTAYLFVKWKTTIDIRRAGSGNVGTMNVFEVTGSKVLGVAVLVVDMVKGIVPVLAVFMAFGSTFDVLATAGLSAIIGHSFPVWIGFRGGRGLATTAGVMLVIGWVFIVIWVVVWAAVFAPTRSIHAGNILASIGSPVVVGLLPQSILAATLPYYTNPSNLLYFSIAFSVIIMITHRQFITTFFQRPTQ